MFDLGKQVPVQSILDKAKEVGRDGDRAVGAARVDEQADADLRRRAAPSGGSPYPVLIGGAAINRNFGRRAALVDGEVFYSPGVFYCKDAFEGLDTVNALVDKASGAAARRAHQARGVRVQDPVDHDGSARRPGQCPAAGLQGDGVARVSVPAPPFWGARVTPSKSIPFAGMFAGMDLKTLYRLHWGARGTGEEYERLIREDFEPRRLRLEREAEERGWI